MDQPQDEQDRAKKNRSPWEIGAAHYDQRDLYTRNARIDDRGYGRGPSEHPEEGSYAYLRTSWQEELDPERAEIRGWRAHHGHETYAREAWPWLRYEAEEGESTKRSGDRRRSGFLPSLPGFLRALKTRFLDRRATRTARRRRERQNAERSDAILRRDVYEKIWRRHEFEVRDVQVSVARGHVTLTGIVADRAMKRSVEALASECAGVREVHNRLRLRGHDDTRTPLVMDLRAF